MATDKKINFEDIMRWFMPGSMDSFDRGKEIANSENPSLELAKEVDRSVRRIVENIGEEGNTPSSEKAAHEARWWTHMIKGDLPGAHKEILDERKREANAPGFVEETWENIVNANRSGKDILR